MISEYIVILHKYMCIYLILYPVFTMGNYTMGNLNRRVLSSTDNIVGWAECGSSHKKYVHLLQNPVNQEEHDVFITLTKEGSLNLMDAVQKVHDVQMDSLRRWREGKYSFEGIGLSHIEDTEWGSIYLDSGQDGCQLIEYERLTQVIFMFLSILLFLLFILEITFFKR